MSKTRVNGRLLVDGHKLVNVSLDAEREALMHEMPAFVRQAETYADVL